MDHLLSGELNRKIVTLCRLQLFVEEQKRIGLICLTDYGFCHVNEVNEKTAPHFAGQFFVCG